MLQNSDNLAKFGCVNVVLYKLADILRNQQVNDNY
jgi:hypothetical protein